MSKPQRSILIRAGLTRLWKQNVSTHHQNYAVSNFSYFQLLIFLENFFWKNYLTRIVDLKLVQIQWANKLVVYVILLPYRSIAYKTFKLLKPLQRIIKRLLNFRVLEALQQKKQINLRNQLNARLRNCLFYNSTESANKRKSSGCSPLLSPEVMTSSTCISSVYDSQRLLKHLLKVSSISKNGIVSKNIKTHSNKAIFAFRHEGTAVKRQQATFSKTVLSFLKKSNWQHIMLRQRVRAARSLLIKQKRALKKAKISRNPLSHAGTVRKSISGSILSLRTKKQLSKLRILSLFQHATLMNSAFHNKHRIWDIKHKNASMSSHWQLAKILGKRKTRILSFFWQIYRQKKTFPFLGIGRSKFALARSSKKTKVAFLQCYRHQGVYSFGIVKKCLAQQKANESLVKAKFLKSQLATPLNAKSHTVQKVLWQFFYGKKKSVFDTDTDTKDQKFLLQASRFLKSLKKNKITITSVPSHLKATATKAAIKPRTVPSTKIVSQAKHIASQWRNKVGANIPLIPAISLNSNSGKSRGKNIIKRFLLSMTKNSRGYLASASSHLKASSVYKQSTNAKASRVSSLASRQFGSIQSNPKRSFSRNSPGRAGAKKLNFALSRSSEGTRVNEKKLHNYNQLSTNYPKTFNFSSFVPEGKFTSVNQGEHKQNRQYNKNLLVSEGNKKTNYKQGPQKSRTNWQYRNNVARILQRADSNRSSTMFSQPSIKHKSGFVGQACRSQLRGKHVPRVISQQNTKSRKINSVYNFFLRFILKQNSRRSGNLVIKAKRYRRYVTTAFHMSRFCFIKKPKFLRSNVLSKQKWQLIASTPTVLRLKSKKQWLRCQNNCLQARRNWSYIARHSKGVTRRKVGKKKAWARKLQAYTSKIFTKSATLFWDRQSTYLGNKNFVKMLNVLNKIFYKADNEIILDIRKWRQQGKKPNNWNNVSKVKQKVRYSSTQVVAKRILKKLVLLPIRQAVQTFWLKQSQLVSYVLENFSDLSIRLVLVDPMKNFFDFYNKRYMFYHASRKLPDSLMRNQNDKFVLNTVNLINFCIRFPRLNFAKILAEHIALEIERDKRHWPFLGLIKNIFKTLYVKHEIKIYGIKIGVYGKIRGSERKRTHVFYIQQKAVPMQQLERAIDYSLAPANTVYGTLGVKVWVFY